MNWWTRFQANLAYQQAKMFRFWGHMTAQRVYYRQAEAAFTRTLALIPDWTAIYLDRGLVYWRDLGDFAHAIDDFTTVLHLDPDRAEALFYRGMAYQAQGDYPTAALDLRAAIEGAPDALWRNNARRQLATVESILEDLPPRLAEPFNS